MTTFQKKLAQLKDDLVTQGDRVVEHVLRSVEAFFDVDIELAESVVDGDTVVDRADVEIERASVPLLAMGETDEHSIRSILTIVKVNNELERIADCGVIIAEEVIEHGELPEPVPRTFRVMANSVIGMLRDANRALAEENSELAQRVLACDDTVDRFRREITLSAQEKVAAGQFSARFAFRLLRVTKALERIADHCTNVCEQIIYLEQGLIVRHLPEGWTAPAPPDV